MNWFSLRSVSKAIQLLGCIFAILLLCVPAFSQGNFGTILGTVTDTSGGVVSGASVTVIDTDRGVSRPLTTDEAGLYNAPNLTPGTYTIRVEAKGFKKLERQNVVLEVGKEIRVDLQVQPGASEQTVTVTESVPLVETTNATLGGTLETSEIVDLPLNGRNYQDLLGLRPGVFLQPGGGPWTQSTNNVRPDESVWLLDGIVNANMYDSRPIANMPSPFQDSATILPVDAIQEFNLMESPKAEYGWKPGAVVNVGIKSGTNTFHGDAYGFYRSAAWDARNLYNPTPQSRPSCAAVGALTGDPTGNNTTPCTLSPVQLKQFGGTVGGPIKKDKLFFFAGFEGQRDFIGNEIVTAGIPETTAGGGTGASMVDAIKALQTAGAPVCSSTVGTNCISPVSLNIAGCQLAPAVTCTGGLWPTNITGNTNFISTFPNTDNSNNGLAKINYQINGQNTLNGLVMVNDYSDTGMDHPFLNAAFENPNLVRTYTAGADWVWTPTSRLVNDLRFGYDKVNFIFLTVDGNVFADGTGGLCAGSSCGGKGYPIDTGVTSFGGLPNINLASFEKLGPWHNRPQNWGNWYTDVQDNVSYLMGKHTWKFGAEYAHINVTNQVPDTVRGRIDFQGGSGSCTTPTAIVGGATDLTDFFCGAPRRGFIYTGDSHRNEVWYSVAGYAQDDWRMTPKVTVNLGLRYSYFAPIREVNNLWANFDPTKGVVQQGQSGVGSTIWKPDHKDFSPRIGFAYDLSGKGTTVVRGGFNLMYSSFTAVEFLNQNGFQNSTAVNVAADPSGACTAQVALGGSCAQTITPGGTILSASTLVPNTNLCWNAGVSPCSAVGLTGQTTVFATGTVPFCTHAVRCNLMAIDPNLTTPYVLAWNIGVQHAIGSNMSLEVGYVGTHGSRLTIFRDINQLGTDGHTRPFDSTNDANGHVMNYLGYINQLSNAARSNYHSLQTSLTKRMSHGVSFVAGYTYAHGLDSASLNRTAYLPQNSLADPNLEYAASDFDVRHRFTFTTTYNVPGIKGYAQMLEGWKLNAIINVQSAQPWTISDTNDNFSANGSGKGEGADRWDFFGNPDDFKSGPNSIPYCSGFAIDASGNYVTSGVTCTTTSGISGVTGAPLSNSATWAAECATHAQGTHPAGGGTSNLVGAGCYANGGSVMTPNATGAFGNMGRNIFRDQGFKNVDFSVFKTFSYKERYSAEFRLEIFNLFNHPISANPYGSANGYGVGNDPSINGGKAFGCGCATADVAGGSVQLASGAQRGMQIGLKVGF